MRTRHSIRVPALLLAAVACSSSPASPPAAADWPMYGHDAAHTFAQPGSQITPDNAASLAEAWMFPTSDVVSASPAVVGGVVYVGSWDGTFYALDAASGSIVWKFQIDCQPVIVPSPPACLPQGQQPPDRTSSDGGVITSSAAVVGGRVYFGGGRTLYALDAASGTLAWKHVFCGNPDDPKCASDDKDPTQIFSSPTVFENKVFLAHTVNGADGYRGAIEAVDAASGNPVWRFEVDPKLDGNGQPIPDTGQNRGCGSVWASAAIDDVHRLAVFPTGDCQADARPPYHEAVLALDVDTGHPRWVYRPRATDACDLDFGASANVLDLDGARYVGIGGKDGTYYVLRADTANPAGDLAWKTNVVFGGSSGGFIGSTAFDGSRVYGGTALGDFGGPKCDPNDPRDQDVEEPSFHALDARTGKVLWEVNLANTFAAASVTNGVVFGGIGPLPLNLNGTLRAYDARSGGTLQTWRHQGSGMIATAAVVVGKRVFYGTGNSATGSGSGVVALALP